MLQAPVANITQDDHTLTQAIQASLNDFNPDETEVFPFEETVREGGRCVHSSLRAMALL